MPFFLPLLGLLLLVVHFLIFFIIIYLYINYFIKKYFLLLLILYYYYISRRPKKWQPKTKSNIGPSRTTPSLLVWHFERRQVQDPRGIKDVEKSTIRRKKVAGDVAQGNEDKQNFLDNTVVDGKNQYSSRRGEILETYTLRSSYRRQ